MPKINLKSLPSKMQEMLVQSYIKQLSKMSYIELHKKLTILGQKTYHQKNASMIDASASASTSTSTSTSMIDSQQTKNKKKTLNKNESISIIISLLQKNAAIRRKILESSIQDLYQYTLNQNQRNEIQPYLQHINTDSLANKTADNEIKQMLSHNKPNISASKQDSVEDAAKQIKQFESQKILNLIESMSRSGTINQRMDKLQKIQVGSVGRYTLKHDNKATQNSNAFSKFIMRSYNMEYHIVTPQFPRYAQTTKNYQLSTEQLQQNLPHQQLSSFNNQLDQYIIQQGRQYRAQLKSLLFHSQYRKNANRLKIGKNKIKYVSQAIKVSSLIKQIQYERASRQPQLLYRQYKIQGCLAQITSLLLEQSSRQSSNKYSILPFSQLFVQIKQLISDTIQEKDHHENKHTINVYSYLQDIIRLLSASVNNQTGGKQHAAYLSHIWHNLQSIYKIQQNIDLGEQQANAIHIHQLAYICFCVQFYLLLTKTGIRKLNFYDLDLKQQNISQINRQLDAGYRLCQFLLLVLNSKSVGSYKMQSVKQSQESRYQQILYCLKALKNLRQIVNRLNQYHKIHKQNNLQGQLPDAQDIYQTQQYSLCMTYVMQLLMQTFHQPSIEQQQQLHTPTELVRVPTLVNIECVGQIFNLFMQFVYDKSGYESQINAIGLAIIYRFVLYLSVPHRHSRSIIIPPKQLDDMLAIILTNSSKQTIQHADNAGISDYLQSSSEQIYYSSVVEKIIVNSVKFRSTQSISLKLLLNMFAALIKYNCFTHMRQRASKNITLKQSGIDPKQITADELIEYLLIQLLDFDELKQQADKSIKIMSQLQRIVKLYCKDKSTQSKLLHFLQNNRNQDK